MYCVLSNSASDVILGRFCQVLLTRQNCSNTGYNRLSRNPLKIMKEKTHDNWSGIIIFFLSLRQNRDSGSVLQIKTLSDV